ncbi:MAG: hypothetical protein GY904_13640 [Planctomycetaceae bacterium]|nr:hypothetical protein [Planctomycetaceae bacterium]
MRKVALEDGLMKADNVVQTLNSATGMKSYRSLTALLIDSSLSPPFV